MSEECLACPTFDYVLFKPTVLHRKEHTAFLETEGLFGVAKIKRAGRLCPGASNSEISLIPPLQAAGCYGFPM